MATGSVICPSCGKLVGKSAAECPFCGRVRPGMFGFSSKLQRFGNDLGITPLVVGLCVGIYVLSLILGLDTEGSGGFMSILQPSIESVLRLGASGWYPVLGLDRWWTVLSAGLLHGGLIHIFFNVMWLRQLLPVANAIYGPGRSLLLFVLSSVCGFLFSTFLGYVTAASRSGILDTLMGSGQVTVGASAAIFGLLGAVVYAGRRGIASSLGRTMWQYAVALFILSAFIPRVDNWAHLGGFVGGYLVARWLNPFKPERTDHLLAGLVALGAAVVAVILSFLSPLS